MQTGTVVSRLGVAFPGDPEVFLEIGRAFPGRRGRPQIGQGPE